MAWQQVTNTYQRLHLSKSLHKTMKKNIPKCACFGWSEALQKLVICRPQKDLLRIQNSVHHLATPFSRWPFCMPKPQGLLYHFTFQKEKKNKKGKEKKRKASNQNKTYFTNWQGPLCCSKQDSCRVCPTQSKAKITWDQGIQLGCCDNRVQDVWHFTQK